MGIYIGRRSSACQVETSTTPAVGNPNPKNFKIVHLEEVGKFVIAEVHYPGVQNYEGRKILVFQGPSIEQVRGTKVLDPHFCNGDHMSPIARFEPTARGWSRARRMCKAESRRAARR